MRRVSIRAYSITHTQKSVAYLALYLVVVAVVVDSPYACERAAYMQYYFVRYGTGVCVCVRCTLYGFYSFFFFFFFWYTIRPTNGKEDGAHTFGNKIIKQPTEPTRRHQHHHRARIVDGVCCSARMCRVE